MGTVFPFFQVLVKRFIWERFAPKITCWGRSVTNYIGIMMMLALCFSCSSVIEDVDGPLFNGFWSIPIFYKSWPLWNVKAVMQWLLKAFAIERSKSKD